MKKNIHPKTQISNFSCSSCKSSFQILSSIDQENVVIEVCSQCHPFYLGKSTIGKVTGRAEKLLHKFETGKKQLEEPQKKISVLKIKPKRKVRQTLADLKIA